MSDQSELVAAAREARIVLRQIATDRPKHGPIATKAQQLVHQLNDALTPFIGDRE